MKPQDTRNEGVSFACLGHFARQTKKKERLLVIYVDPVVWSTFTSFTSWLGGCSKLINGLIVAASGAFVC